MGILTAGLGLLSCTLVGAGVWLVLRDVRKVKANAAPPGVQAEDAPFAWRAIRRTAGWTRSNSAGAMAPAPPAAEVGAAHPAGDSASVSPIADAASLSPVDQFHAGPADLASEAESRERWSALEPALASALRAVNGAFAQVGASLVGSGEPEWDALEGAHVLSLTMRAAGRDAGRIAVAVTAGDVEITASARRRDGEALTRLRRLAPDAANIQSLAEAIAACAWPIVAAVRGEAGVSR